MYFIDIRDQLKQEIQSALDIWKDLLVEFHGVNLAYVYAKGSSIKSWDSEIDYIPVLSDIDIHYEVHDRKHIFPELNPREKSIEISQEYENRFKQNNPNCLHIPRSQIICLQILKGMIDFVGPLPSSIVKLYGDEIKEEKISDDEVKKIDLIRLEELGDYLNKLPEAWFDKTEFDYWSSLRQLNWRVGPSPVRILTQILPNPLKVWTWNRTKIVHELEHVDLYNVADLYKEYYTNGWRLFRSIKENNAPETKFYVNCLMSGANLLESCYNWFCSSN